MKMNNRDLSDWTFSLSTSRQVFYVIQTLQTDGFLCFMHYNIKIFPPHYNFPKIISAASAIYILKIPNLQ